MPVLGTLDGLGAPEGWSEANTPIAWSTNGVPEDMDREEWRDWFDACQPSSRKKYRDDLVVAGLQAGYTLQEMGDAFGFSRERARQIAAARGIKTKELREARKAQDDRRRRRQARHIYGISLTHPELTVAEIAEWVEADPATVREALEHRLAVHETRATKSDHGRTSDQALIAALAEWGTQSESLTGDDYTTWANERGLPGKQTIAIRFTSWNAALALAGLGQRVRDRGGLRPVIADQELWASIVEFLRSDLPGFSFKAYDEWASAHALPGGASVRNRLGEWSHVHATARRLLRYAVDRDGSWPWGDEILDVVPGEVPRNRVTRDMALDSLRRVAPVIDGPVTVLAYEEARSRDDVAANHIQRLGGSWIRALLDAGLEDRLSGKARGKLERGEVHLGDVEVTTAQTDLPD